MPNEQAFTTDVTTYASAKAYEQEHQHALDLMREGIKKYWHALDKQHALLHESLTEPFSLPSSLQYIAFMSREYKYVDGWEKTRLLMGSRRRAMTDIKHAIIAEFHDWLMNSPE